MNPSSPLVSADWLKANLEAPDVRVIDASWFPSWTADPGAGREAYAKAHIPGAVYFDIEEIADTNSALPHMLPDAVKFSSRVRQLGLGDGNRIIVYDANDFIASARVWWMFRVMGHQDVFVLDGGLRAWQRAGGDTEDLPPVVTGGRHFTPRVRTDLVRSLEQMQAASAGGGTCILDARPVGRFNGTEAEPREGLPSGHIPGSISKSASNFVRPDGTLAPRAELEKLLRDYVRQPAIATCGSGVSAGIIALALAELGNWDVAVYDGSWTEWASQPENPVQTRVE